MSNFDNEMMQAYLNSLNPSIFKGEALDDYIFLTDLMTKDMQKLISLLPPEHGRFAEECYYNMHLYINFSNKVYFEQGWLAAKEDNKLDHY